MKRFTGLILLLIPVVLCAQQSSHNGAPKYAPEDGNKLLIIGQDLGAVGGLDLYSDGYVNHMDHVPAGVTTYTGFPSLTGLTQMANWGSGDVHAQAYIEDTTFDHSAIAIGLHLVDQLGSIINGTSDHLLEQLGGWIMAQERPVFLRIGYEFDGSWNHYNPDQYKGAWIYIVDYFDELGVKNVAYVWQAHGGNTPNIERWYPGDEYVNWMGYSHFDEPDPGANILSIAESHNKPVMIAEAAPKVDLKTGSGTDHWNSWYGPLFSRIYENDRIKALAYINVDWDSQPMWTGQGWGDSRVQVSGEVKQNWLAEIRKEPWLLASDSLFRLLDFNLWQDSVVGITEPVSHVNSQVIAISDSYRLKVKSTDGSPMDAIRIWDISGRLLYQSQVPATEYEIPFSRLGGGAVLIMQIRKGDMAIGKKTIVLN